jgi:hypothetical protein
MTTSSRLRVRLVHQVEDRRAQGGQGSQPGVGIRLVADLVQAADIPMENGVPMEPGFSTCAEESRSAGGLLDNWQIVTRRRGQKEPRRVPEPGRRRAQTRSKIAARP